jgi:transglutaminase-like putative cysteine protease
VAIDLRKTLMIAVILILFVSWAIPLTSFEVERYSKFWKDFSAPWKKLQERVSDIFGPIEYEATVSNDSFGNFLNLGQSINLGSNTIFVAESSHGENWDLPYYWRAQTYDVILEDRWFAGDGLESEFISPQNFQFPQSNNKSRERIEFSVEMKTFQETNIYIVNEPVYVSRPVEIVSFFSAEEPQEIVSVFANPPMQSGEIYQVHALVPNPTRVELRETGMEYPDWVDRYLQLPPDFPEEIRQLALEITQQETNPFDKSQAITRYLRNTITYEEVLPEIPANQDPIAWFLFTHRAGFCNYYATAQVLMLRSIGIPARLAVGYAQGEFDQLTGIFTVKQKDRHAWPEVYINEYGWIEFEPTTAQPNIERPIGQISEATIESRILPEMEEETPVIETATPEPTIEVVQDIQVKQESGTYVLLFLISLFLLAILASYFVLWLVTPQIRVTPISNILSNIYNKLSISEPEWLKNWSAKQAQKPFKQAYKSIGNAIKHLGGKMNKSDTPSERGKLLLKLLPDYKNDIEDLIYQYELAKFSPHQADIQKANASSLKIKKAVQVYMLENRFIKNK